MCGAHESGGAQTPKPRATTPHISKQSTLGERDDSFADDQVVNHADVYEREGVLEAMGEEFVGLGRLGISGRVVVYEDYGRGIARQGFFDDFAGVDGCVVEGAAEQFDVFDEAVAVVEEHGREDFVVEGSELQAHELAHAVGCGECWGAGPEALRDEVAGAFEDGVGGGLLVGLAVADVERRHLRSPFRGERASLPARCPAELLLRA